MKTLKTFSMVAALMLAPVLANAQWSAVRYDSTNVYQLVFAANPNDVFVIGTAPFTGDYFLLRSADGGTNWDSVGLNTPQDEFQVFEMYFPDANNGFIGGRKNNASQSLRKTVNNGNTWTDITPDPSNIQTISGLFFLDAQQGWATSGQELYITSNGGTSWSTVALNFTPQDIYFMDALTGYASGGSIMSSPAVVMKTTDGGQTWTQVLQNNDPNFFVSTNLFLNVVDANTIFTLQQWTNKMYRTRDAGATWDTIVCDSAYQITDFHFESADSGHVLTSLGQLYYTTDAGATWTLMYSAEWGLYGPSVYFYSLMFSQGVGYVCGSSGLIKRFDSHVTGIHNSSPLAVGFSVYPNPCYYSAPIMTFEGVQLKGELNIRVINVSGQVAYEAKLPATMNGIVQFNYENILAPGNYTVVLSDATQQQSGKVIIAK